MLAIRLRRMGSKHRPYYRIVVSENEKTPRSRCVDEIGFYHPMSPGKELKVDTERAQQWLDRGARPSDTVRALLKKHAQQQ